MKSMSFLISDRQTGYFAAAIAALLAVIIVPIVVTAAQVTERSIALSNSSAGVDGVQYNVKFKAVQGAGAFVVQFCDNTPVIGLTCEAPDGFSASGVSSGTADFTATSSNANTAVVSGTIAANADVDVALQGISNPDEAGTIYARIVTYDTPANANTYQATALGSGNRDQGGVAIAITDTIGVSGVVMESLTFCVSGDPITDGCASPTPPTIPLGEDLGDGIVALVAGELSEGTIYSQISTNAVNGAVVRLKSNAENCGGLLRAGAPGACDILPALRDGITPAGNEAKFGVRAVAATDAPGNSNGTFRTVPESGYNDTTYALNYASGNTSGVTSTYGDPFLDTAGAPASGKNMNLTFGATIANDTPAGLYSADLSMIAVGTF